MKTIVFTGGGTAGHVTPNLALISRLDKSEWNIHYFGMSDSIEQRLLKDCPEVQFHCITSGKVRRYFSLKNLTDPFKVLKGIRQARSLLKKIKPDVVFSKGGFVSVPVVMAAKKRCPVIVHESDYTPGLANRIATKYADTVCITFSDTDKHIKGDKAVLTGTPIREELFSGSKERAMKFTGLSGEKPVLLVMGGSQGAQAINELVRSALPMLLPRFDIIHLCGEGKVDTTIASEGYLQYAYIGEQLPDIFALADLVVSRAGSNSIFEFLALELPAILIPLPLSASRGDQILNANYFEQRSYAVKLDQEQTTANDLVVAVNRVYDARRAYKENMRKDRFANGTDQILNLIFRVTNK